MLSLETVATEMLVSFAVNQLATYGADLNPAQAKAHAHTILAAAFHSSTIEGVVEKGADAIIDEIPVIAKNADDVKNIVDAVAAGDMPTAMKTFKGLVVKALPPKGEFTPQLTQLLTAA